MNFLVIYLELKILRKQIKLKKGAKHLFQIIIKDRRTITRKIADE